MKVKQKLWLMLVMVLWGSQAIAQNSNKLFHAIWKDDLSKIKQLLNAGMDINGYYDRSEKNGCLDCAGWTPYIAACIKGNMKVIKYLEKRGADIKKTAASVVRGKDTYSGEANALHEAAHYGNIDIAKYLLGKGFDIDSKNSYNSTPLVMACVNNDREQLDMVKFLVKRGANIKARNTAVLFETAYRGYNKIITYLLDKGANVNAVWSNTARSYKGSRITPIYKAVNTLRANTVKLLISRGANVQKIKGAKIAPLHLAASRKAFYCAYLLLKNGAKADELNYRGKTPADVARQKKGFRIAELLEGAKLTKIEQHILKYTQGNIKGFDDVSFTPPDFHVKKLESSTLTDIKGKTFTMKDLRGKIVFLNIWATWCGPCLREMPEMIKLQKALKGKPFVILALSVDEDLSKLKAFQRREKYPFMIAHDANRTLWNKVLGGSLPSTHIFGKDGKKLAYVGGYTKWSEPKYIRFFEGLVK